MTIHLRKFNLIPIIAFKVIFLFFVVLSGCTTHNERLTLQPNEILSLNSQYMDAEYHLGVGDVLSVKFFYDDKLNPDVAKYEKILGDAGITSDKTVVVYADVKGITSASVGYWILELFGQKDVRFLNGGIEAWEAAGKKLDTVEKKLPSAKYNANLMKSSIATTDEVLKVAKGTVKNVQIVDSRTPGEYAGTDVRAKRGGHIPTTVLNVSHVETFDSKTGMIKSTEELEKLFGKLDKNKRTIPYCHTGTRSTLLYLIFETMGFKDVANYDDSWIIWGNREDTPIEK